MYSLFVERALRVQALEEAAEDACRPTAICRDGPGRERGRRSASQWAGVRSRSSRTTTRARSSPSGARRASRILRTSSRSARADPVLDSLRFGSLRNTRCYLLDEPCGIATTQLDRCATIGGEVYFEVYDRMPHQRDALGWASVRSWCAARRRIREHALLCAHGLRSRGVGLASAELATDRRDKRPTVQVATRSERKAARCSLDLLERADRRAADLGAAG